MFSIIHFLISFQNKFLLFIAGVVVAVVVVVEGTCLTDECGVPDDV
jgi:hypothetical protein